MDEMAAHRQRWRERMVTHFIRSFMVFNLDLLLPAFGEISICQVFFAFHGISVCLQALRMPMQSREIRTGK